MRLNSTWTTRGAVGLGTVALLLGGAACSSTVTGAASYTGEGSQTTTTTTETTTSTSGDSTNTSSTGDSKPAQAPDEPFVYNNGVTVTLGAASERDSSLLLSTEVGRVVPVTIENASSTTIDTSSLRLDSDVTCGADQEDMYLIPNSDDQVGPEMLPAGQTGNYELFVALLEEYVGEECLISVVFAADGVSSSSIDPALFTMVLN